MKQPVLKFFIATVALAMAVVQSAAQIPTGYYQSLKGKKGAELKTAIHQLVGKAKVLDYGSGTNSTWWGFYVTDNDNGHVIDRYSNNVYSFGKRGSAVGGMNIEHSFPKSWWGGSMTQAYQDLFNLMPSDKDANSSKSNFGMGVVTQTSGKGYYDNGCIKVGDSGMGFKVWQPSKEWQGDFARDYMYMATAYQDYTWKDNAAQNSLEQNEWPTLKEWAYTLYIKWAKEDPVSQTEVKRNNAVYGIQGNRNPYVDFPNLMEYVWGDSIDVAFNPETSVKSDKTVEGGDTPVTPDTPDGTATIYSRNFKTNGGDCTVTTSLAPSTGKTVWTRDVKYGWVGTAFSNKKAYAADASITTPELDLTAMENAKLTFHHAVNFCANPSQLLSVEVIYSDGEDDISEKLGGVTWPAGNDWKFVSSGDIDLTPYVGGNIKIRFHYTSTDALAGTWEISDIEVTGKRTATAIGSPSAPLSSGFDPSKPYEVYDLSGVRLSSLERGHGVVIVRQGGRSWKVVI